MPYTHFTLFGSQELKKCSASLRFYSWVTSIPFCKFSCCLFECPCKQNNNYIMTISRLTWILRYHCGYTTYSDFRVVQIRKKMHIRVSESRYIILNILLYPFLHSAKKVKNTCSHGVYVLIRDYLQVLKTYSFSIQFFLWHLCSWQSTFELSLSKYLLSLHSVLGTKLWDRQ